MKRMYFYLQASTFVKISSTLNEKQKMKKTIQINAVYQ